MAWSHPIFRLRRPQVINKTDGSRHFTGDDAQRLSLFATATAAAMDNQAQYQFMHAQLTKAVAVFQVLHDFIPRRHAIQDAHTVSEAEVEAYAGLWLSQTELDSLREKRFNFHYYKAAPPDSPDSRRVVTVVAQLYQVLPSPSFNRSVTARTVSRRFSNSSSGTVFPVCTPTLCQPVCNPCCVLPPSYSPHAGAVPSVAFMWLRHNVSPWPGLARNQAMDGPL